MSRQILYPRKDEDRPQTRPDANGLFRTWNEVYVDALKARGLTYANLAEKWDISVPGVKRRIYAANPQLETMEEMCKTLHLHLDELLARRRYPKQVPRRDEWGRKDVPEDVE